jgi:hypothetical protein
MKRVVQLKLNAIRFCLVTLSLFGVTALPSKAAGQPTKSCDSLTAFVQKADVSWTPVVCKNKTVNSRGEALSPGTEVMFRNSDGVDLFVVFGRGRFGRKNIQTVEANGVTTISVQIPKYVFESRAIEQSDIQLRLAKNFARTGLR